MVQRSRKQAPEQRSWAELFCSGWECLHLSAWPRVVFRKWLNVSSLDSDFSADEDEEENHLHNRDTSGWEREGYDVDRGMNRLVSNGTTSKNACCKIHRPKAEMLHAQYINTKELRICVGTWNVGGRSPPDDLEIKEWLNTQEHADIYVIGLQEIVPLNAVNIFGIEDNVPVSKWETIIRETLDRTLPVRSRFKSHSDPPSPSKFKPTDDTLSIGEIFSENDSDSDGEVQPLDDQYFHYQSDEDPRCESIDDSLCISTVADSGGDLSQKHEQLVKTSKKFHYLHHCHLSDNDKNPETSFGQQRIKLANNLSNSVRIGLGSSASSKICKPFTASDKCKSSYAEDKPLIKTQLISELNKHDSVRHRRKRSVFVRIISKQMVGIFLSIWVRRRLRRHMQNLRVSTVGVGVMGYIGNKGSISVSVSIYQTPFCFVCTHLSAGERDGDEHRRNTDVQEIHRRTQFGTTAVSRTIHDHERIIWLGDLNYRINLSYEETLQLISKKEWPKLAEMDQLKHELGKGRAFDGWTEGVLNFPPTYKYELDSEDYTENNSKAGRRKPAWCDRILSFGKGLRLLRYKRSELSLSDHRPVTAIFSTEVEVFSQRRLERAPTSIDAEVEAFEITSHVEDG